MSYFGYQLLGMMINIKKKTTNVYKYVKMIYNWTKRNRIDISYHENKFIEKKEGYKTLRCFWDKLPKEIRK